MDPRLTKAVNEKYCDGETFVLRNAGSNVMELKESITDLVEGNDVKEIVLMIHGAFDNDHPEEKCAAMREVYEAITEGKKESEVMQTLLVRQFEEEAVDYPTLKDVEEMNVAIQQKKLKVLLKDIGAGDIKVSVLKVKTSEVCFDYNEHRGEHYEKRVSTKEACNSDNYILQSAKGRELPASEELIRSKGKTELKMEVASGKPISKNKVKT
ncbi:MAG TPA: hypothetical protein VNF06_01020 [Candidatus Aquilonibacter sp.]|nr:hypothetical protein [Candidatus Aquilonibacter sp.]